MKKSPAIIVTGNTTWTRSQFVRMPDGMREGGARQAVYFFNPEVMKNEA